MELRFIANAGLALTVGKSTVLVDALHRGNPDGYQQVTEEIWEQMKSELPSPELIFFTHCHPDHFSRVMLEEARGVWPGAMVAIPEKFGYEQLLLSGQRGRIGLQSCTLEYYRLTHEGEEYTGVSHYGVLIRAEGKRIFISGDCRLGAEEISAYPELQNVDVAIMNYPWVSLRGGRKVIDEILCPKKLIVCHLPDAESDVYNYKEAVEKAIGRYYPGNHVRMLTDAFQKVIL